MFFLVKICALDLRLWHDFHLAINGLLKWFHFQLMHWMNPSGFGWMSEWFNVCGFHNLFPKSTFYHGLNIALQSEQGHICSVPAQAENSQFWVTEHSGMILMGISLMLIVLAFGCWTETITFILTVFVFLWVTGEGQICKINVGVWFLFPWIILNRFPLLWISLLYN